MPWIESTGDAYRVRDRDPAGRKVWLTGLLPTRQACDDWMGENDYRLTGRQTRLDALVDAWARSQADSPYSRQVRAAAVRVFLATGWTTVGNLSRAALERWNGQAGGRAWKVPGRGVTRYWQYLRTVLRWAAEVHHVPVDPDVLALSPPRRPRRPGRPLLTDREADTIRAESMRHGLRAAALIDYLLTYGARPITACRLRVRDLDLARCELTIPDAKRSGGWVHPVLPDQAAVWRSLAADAAPADAPLFPHPHDDRPWRIDHLGRASEVCNWYRNAVVKRPIRLGLLPPHAIYDLKRYAITRALAEGLDSATVALFTGHMDLSQVLRYARTNAQRAIDALPALTRRPAPNPAPMPPQNEGGH